MSISAPTGLVDNVVVSLSLKDLRFLAELQAVVDMNLVEQLQVRTRGVTLSKGVTRGPLIQPTQYSIIATSGSGEFDPGSG
eukprot:1265491-Pyramimonas_sp.AAC.2